MAIGKFVFVRQKAVDVIGNFRKIRQTFSRIATFVEIDFATLTTSLLSYTDMTGAAA